jgi:hypothetical protein
MGFSTHQKNSAVMLICAYGIPAEYADEAKIRRLNPSVVLQGYDAYVRTDVS